MLKCFKTFSVYYYFKFLKNILKTTKKLHKFLLFFKVFFPHHYNNGTIEIKKAQEKNLNRILGLANTLLILEKRKDLEKNKNREDNIIKDIKKIFELKN